MNPKVETIKMFGPSISDPTKIVNREVPVCDEQAYMRAGYKRGSVEDVVEPKPINLTTEEVSLEEPESVVEPPKPRKRKGQN